MLMTPDFLNFCEQHPDLNDHEFLGRLIWYVKNVFNREMVAVKNSNCEFVALTDRMSEEFNLKEDILGKTFNIVPTVAQVVRDEIYLQEQQLLKDRIIQESFYFYKKDNNICNYTIRKRAIINPASDQVVGILVHTEKLLPNTYRKFIVHEFLNLADSKSKLEDPHLPPLHQQIIFCLLIGITSRKEIAATLSNITNQYCPENKIKNALSILYKKFNCSTPTELVNLVLTGQIPLEIPEHTIPPGNYLLKSTVL